jgi:hypothetical protein
VDWAKRYQELRQLEWQGRRNLVEFAAEVRRQLLIESLLLAESSRPHDPALYQGARYHETLIPACGADIVVAYCCYTTPAWLV